MYALFRLALACQLTLFHFACGLSTSLCLYTSDLPAGHGTHMVLLLIDIYLAVH